jgi:hypothetical protein
MDQRTQTAPIVAPGAPPGRWCARGGRAAGIAALLLLGVTAFGCSKRVPVSATETNIADGREFEIDLTGDRQVRGKLLPGSTVRFEQGDSLFNAEVHQVTEEFIEFSRRELVADQSDYTRLSAAAEDAAKGVDRPELGGALLPRDEIESVSVLTLDRRRIVVETICWTALLLAAGYAGLSH